MCMLPFAHQKYYTRLVANNQIHNLSTFFHFYSIRRNNPKIEPPPNLPTYTQPTPNPSQSTLQKMALTPAQATLLERVKTEFTKEKVSAELHRRELNEQVSRWAMITRKMKNKPSHDVLHDFTELMIDLRENAGFRITSSTDNIINYVLLLSSRKRREVEVATRMVAYVTMGDRACIDTCVSAGAVPTLVKLLSSRKGMAPVCAAGALWNIAAGDATHNAACVSAGAIPALVGLLSSNNEAEYEMAAGALWGIAMGDAACKLACVEAGAVPALMALLLSPRCYTAVYAAGALLNIAIGDAACKTACVSAGILPAIRSVLARDDILQYSKTRITNMLRDNGWE